MTWLDIPGHAPYQVNEDGVVRHGEHLRIYARFKDKLGYWRVSLPRGEAKHGPKLCHRLVALAFFGPPATPDLIVHHIDSNPSHCHVSNLEWTTQQRNIRIAYDTEFCKGGLHRWEPHTTYVSPDGRRRCRLCARATELRNRPVKRERT